MALQRADQGGRREADLGFQKFQLLLHLAAFGGKFNTASPSKGAAVLKTLRGHRPPEVFG